MKLDPDPIREKTIRVESNPVRSGSVATSATDLTDNLKAVSHPANSDGLQ